MTILTYDVIMFFIKTLQDFTFSGKYRDDDLYKQLENLKNKIVMDNIPF